MKKPTTLFLILIALGISFGIISGCANMSNTEQRMWSGAAIGGTLGGPIGAGVGVASGYVVSKLENDE